MRPPRAASPSPRSRPARWRFADRALDALLRVLPPIHPSGDDQPLVTEVSSPERLEQVAELLASAHEVLTRRGRWYAFVLRSRDNARALLDAYHAIVGAVGRKHAITPAADWLLNNFHVIEEQLRDIHKLLPAQFYRQLPKLSGGELRDLPRAYAITWAFIAHTDGRFDPELLLRFLRAYQRVSPLTIGELWALPIMLRIAMVENLRRLAVRILISMRGRTDADLHADALLGLEGSAAARPPAEYFRGKPVPASYAVQLLQRLHYPDTNAAPTLAWLNQRLAEEGVNADALVRQELQKQTAANLSVRNLITGMRLVSALDWEAFFESASLVTDELKRHPDFAAMDFRTRDRYRHAVEQLALHCPLDEVGVAAAANTRADAAAAAQAAVSGAPAERRDAEPGFYLIDEGRRGFKASIGYAAGLLTRVSEPLARHTLPVYLGLFAVLTASLLAFALQESAAAGLAPWPLGLLALLALIPASDVALTLVNRAVSEAVAPQHMPRLALTDGVPPALATCVVVPTFLTDEAALVRQVRQLETHCLANAAGTVYFALLTDWRDAAQEQLPDDSAVLEAAVAAIANLNARYGPAPGGAPRFYVFHRRRRWNAADALWMGWERKRGKLHEFNRLLRGLPGTSFITDDAVFTAPPSGVRFVLTLDADTLLPMDAVAKLVGTLAHPLNRPRFDADGRVTGGYGILQPRIAPTLPSRQSSSWYQRLFSGHCGMDPYTFHVSDVYQDLFGEGSFTGKGLYEVDTFERALAGRVPDNAVLSHDLLESVFARCGFVSDVELFEEFPSHTEVAAARMHRWTRGDWQLLPYIAGRQRTGVSALGRWKMLDNLRRSLSAPAAVSTLLASWLIPGAPLGILTVLVVSTLALPLLPASIWNLVPRLGVRPEHWLGAILRDLAQSLATLLTQLALMADHACRMLDAIARTLARLVQRQRLLEWTTAAQTEASVRYSLGSFFGRMRPSLLLTLLLLTLVTRFQPESLTAAAPFLVLWLCAPFIAWRISQPPPPRETRPLDRAEILRLRLHARRTWRYFATFVTARDHALPPDNFQETPSPVVAHRSSPTNIGLYLLSAVAAHDFGWIGRAELAERLAATFASLAGLPRHRGHFFNWIETEQLRPLDPRYVSTVDSGNLAAMLLALARACREYTRAPIDTDAALQGIADDLALMRIALRELDPRRRSVIIGEAEITEALDAAERLTDIAPGADTFAPRLQNLAAAADLLHDVARGFADERGDAATNEVLAWADLLRATIASHRRDLDEPAHDRFAALARQARALFNEMDFTFLYDPTRKLFAIGYQVDEGRLDPGYYDLLASEARLTSFIAIAKRDVPPLHWFKLGRTMVPLRGGGALTSWSGSMFEYLMPSLLLYTPRGSLLDDTCRLVVDRQIAYGLERSTPWGISESAYNKRDLQLTYQYSNFGVPGLGLKRGLAQDLVVAPYATGLGAMYDPRAALANFDRMEALGGLGRYGFYEALDFTAARRAENEPVAIVQAYMAHHQGMLLTALANVVFDGRMRHRFHAEPMVRAAGLLLQETRASDVSVAAPRVDRVTVARVEEAVEPVERRIRSPHTPAPATQLLSNGRYCVMLTAAGSGYSLWRNQAVTRWREDVTCDHWGSFVYLRDVAAGTVWSAGFQPTCAEPYQYEVQFAEDRVRISRSDHGIESVLEVIVSAEDDAEIRRLTLKNVGNRAREIEVTTYAEIVLNTVGADLAHPAYSNLFVQTEYVAHVNGIFATRRPRASYEPELWFAHVIATRGDRGIEYETDRARFLGRGRTTRAPLAVMDGRPLSNTVGAVLDPIASLRVRVLLPEGTSVHIPMATMAAGSRAEILALADKYHDPAAFERASSLAWTHAQVQLHHLGIGHAETHLYQQLANRLLYADRSLRPGSEVLAQNRLPARRLWQHAISGDRPIVLARIDDDDDHGLIRQLLTAHKYWQMKRLAVDLVILNDKSVTYVDALQHRLEEMVADSLARAGAPADREGSIHVLRSDRLSADERLLLHSSARAILASRAGSLAEQIGRMRREPPPARPRRAAKPPVLTAPLPVPALAFANGLGGFADEGREYVVSLQRGSRTPAPWINVIANDGFGFQVSESGAGYTWAGNSRENQLTPWSNDPVGDPVGEAFYLRDLDSGALWTPTAAPIRHEDGHYLARYSAGYATFTHLAYDIDSKLTQFVDLADPVKISELVLTNRSLEPRRIAITGYVEWVLGATRTSNAPYIATSVDPGPGVVYATNPWSNEFGQCVAFACWDRPPHALTCDRTEFIGRNGRLGAPAALAPGVMLSGRSGAGFDPCAALECQVTIAPGAAVTVRFLLGQTDSREKAQRLVEKHRATSVQATLRAIRQHWDAVLKVVQVATPDPAFDLMINRWLLYQTAACRISARAAFYQAGGAYGFRDQLQDTMALAVTQPQVARDQIVRAAARQFSEGDVQHWWHPPTGRGVRTHSSDDRLWLPYCTAHYLAVTDDTAVLDQTAPFLEGLPIPPGREDLYFEPTVSAEQASIFEHCARALDISLGLGQHGLPLIMGGDWNDGMNRVGVGGRGESVWLGWFLLTTLRQFVPLAAARGEPARAERWRAHADTLQAAIEREGWDGAWYKRAFFDDGTPLGSAFNAECRIDSLAQSWAVISGAADPVRAARAMSSVDEYLVKEGDDMVLLFAPPFDKAPVDPGYIKGYVPGVRENGGQYTHAAAWCVMAQAMQGNGDRAMELFAMLNPINHASTRTGVHRYKVEPYVVAADVYGEPPHTGRGGWTWYTGAAGWLYRAGVEYLLGFRVRGDSLIIDPCIPSSWPGFTLQYTRGATRYEISVDNASRAGCSVTAIELDGTPLPPGAVPLVDDGAVHRLRVVLG